MKLFTDHIRRWMQASRETQALLRRNEELLEQREKLLRAVRLEFRQVLRLAGSITEEAFASRQEEEEDPEAGSPSPRSK